MPLFYSLKRALTFNFVLVAVVPVLIFGLINIDLVTDHQLEGSRERNLKQAMGLAEDVKAFLLEIHYDLHHVKHAIEPGLILNPENVDPFLSSVVSYSQSFESIYLVSSDYRVRNLGLRAGQQEKQDDFLNHDFSGSPLLKKVSSAGGPVWSDIFLSVFTGEPSVTLGLPVHDGYLLGNVRLNSLNGLLQRYTIFGDTEVAIADAHGTLIAHSVPGLAEQRINYAHHPAVAAALEGETTTQEYLQGEEYFLESSVSIEGSDWVVWVGLNMNEVWAPIHKTRNWLLSVMAIALSLASLIALVNVRRLLGPLTALGNRAREIADGHYEFKFQPSGLVEIDALAGQIANMTHDIKIREESILASEERFRGLVNSIDGIVWELEYPSFKFLFVSQHAESILGYPVQDWYEIADFWMERTHPDDVNQAMAYCRLMAEKQEDHSFEYRMITADDRVVWIRDLVTVVVENGRPVRLLGVMLDVTQEKELIEDLARSEQNYREIFNATSDAIFIHDAETGKTLDVNQSMLNLFECTYEEALVGGIERFSKNEPPYTAVEATQKILEARKSGSCSFEWMSRRGSGEVFWTEVYLRSAMIGSSPRVLAAVRDISSRKEAADRLREANERLQLLVERMPIGCIFWAPDMTVDLWNPYAESIFGYSHDEIRDKGPYETIFMVESRNNFDQIWKRLMEGDKTAHSADVNLTKDRGPITCEWVNTPVHDSSGRIIGVISMVQDISERKASERELELYRTHLEELVEERTCELEKTQQQLVKNERLAVLGQLTATVSHEIRNPLGTVANSLFLLKDALESENRAHLQRPLELAERNVERCDDIISDLLDFSRHRKIIKAPLDIDSWLEELVNELSVPKDVNCVLSLDAKVPVPADAERLRRVMVNVITNALQALDEGRREGKKLLVKTLIANETCEILVRDNGPGMSEEVLANIYEPMFSTKNFGVGLGVPIIKNIMEGHGGTVTYLSELGGGTAVSLSLPLHDKPEES